ncbi:MAG TPA: ISL3 family transposase, partial [Ktedonobacteraceae bacterium]|nr:ISL3 family transposase [Ktedonobacteraceae bacterium]
GDLAEPYARRTSRLREALLAIGWALGGEAGIRQCARHAMPMCAATMLKLLRNSGAAVPPTPRVLGVDDWSFQAHSAGTLLVDLERHQPVEVLLGSDEKVLSDWLLAHPGVEVICRDRGVSYLNGATKGAPQAKQVLDRWHVLKNMGEVLQKILAQHMDVLQQAAGEAVSSETECQAPAVAQLVSQSASQAQEPCVQRENPSPMLEPPARKPPQRKPAAPRKQRRWQLHMYEQVHRLSAEGWSGRAIAHHLHLHPKTVRKYVSMEQFVDQRHNPHGSCVEPYRAYLQERWAQGCTMVKTLWQELKALGFTGSYKSVCLFTRTFLVPGASPTTSSSPKRAGQQPRTPWQTKWLLLHELEELSAPDASYREAVCRLSPELAQAACLARRFGHMVRKRRTDHLDDWLEEARASPLQELHRFALG